MSSVVPHRFLFRAELPVRRVNGLPSAKKGGRLDLPDDCRLADLSAIDGAPVFADVRMAWNPRGLGVSAHVTGKKRPPACDSARPLESDGLAVWIDTRATQNVHRATKFCHLFCLLPAGGDGGGPFATQLPVPRAREDAALCDPGDILIAGEANSRGWQVEAWLPAAILHGFDPESQPRLGFHYAVRDSDLGLQTPAVASDFPYEADPSLWNVLALTSG